MQFTNENLGGSFGAKKVILHNSYWVHKVVRAEWEVRAYEIYKAIIPYKRGHWYIPETIYGPLSPHEEVTSLQAYVTDAAVAHELYYVPDPVTAAEMSAFDFLIEQGDRHRGNFLIDLAGQCVLIDHGNAFEYGYCSNTFRRYVLGYYVNYWAPATEAIEAVAPVAWRNDIMARLRQLSNFPINQLPTYIVKKPAMCNYVRSK